MKKINKNMTSFAEHLTQQYGELGTDARAMYEGGVEAFKESITIVYKSDNDVHERPLPASR